MSTASHTTEKTLHRWRILVVDDHPLVRAGLASLISNEADMEVCAEAAGQGEALQRLKECTPDLAIIDISLGEGSGFSLIRHIKAMGAPVRMLVLSMHDESLYAERAIRAGAMGYVNKQEAAEHVVEAIRKVLAGKVYLSERVTERILLGMTQGSSHDDDSPLANLSDRELEVFWLVGEGVGASEIASRLHLSVKTIETHRDKLKKKLGIDSASELNRFAMQWLLEHPAKERTP
ncbi:MAG: response regulator transcription factor [Thiothrix sp.]